MIKDTFLTKITYNELYAFYQNYMIGYYDYTIPEYQQEALDVNRNEHISKSVINKAITAIQKQIILFAQNILNMNPIKLYFPKGKIIYRNTYNTLNQVAGSWKRQQELTVSLEDLPEYITQYDAITVINTTVKHAGLREGIGLTLLNNYFEGGKI